MKSQIHALSTSLKSLYYRLAPAYEILIGKKKGNLDQYTDQVPDPQNILDIFKEEWVSKFPEPFNHLKAGNMELFNDSRLEWALKQMGDIKGKKVLELGPLEGGHSYTLQKHGAQVVAVEANPRAYLRCLATKQILNLNHVDFLYGDFTKYLNDENLSFDVCVACGVLYHMCHPVELISQLAKSSSKVFIWTHYYDPVVCEENPRLTLNFKEQSKCEYAGFKHTVYKHNYGITSGKKFLGGPARYSNWLSREEILGACKYFGFEHIQISPEHDCPKHIHGPSFAFVASKRML